jgi:hypothetical protein
MRKLKVRRARNNSSFSLDIKHYASGQTILPLSFLRPRIALVACLKSLNAKYGENSTDLRDAVMRSYRPPACGMRCAILPAAVVMQIQRRSKIGQAAGENGGAKSSFGDM